MQILAGEGQRTRASTIDIYSAVIERQQYKTEEPALSRSHAETGVIVNQVRERTISQSWAEPRWTTGLECEQ